MQLALQFGRTLKELGESMTAEEFGLWWALWKEEPFGEWAHYFRSSLICSTLANYAGKCRKEGAQPANPMDFMVFHKTEEKADVDPDPIEFFNQFK